MRISRIIQNVVLAGTTELGFTEEQMYSTASYRAKDSRGVDFSGNDLSGWDFSQQDLRGIEIQDGNLAGLDLRGADLRNAIVLSGTLSAAHFDSETIYNQWTIFSQDFDPVEAGLTLVVSQAGDLNANDTLDVGDIDQLSCGIESHWSCNPPLPNAEDLNGDGNVSIDDHNYWVHNLKRTWYGDADLNGHFDSTDLVQVLASGQFERTSYDVWYSQGLPYPPATSWSEGDWNADGEFNSADLVVALADGGYEQGPRAAVSAVPEPSAACLLSPQR